MSTTEFSPARSRERPPQTPSGPRTIRPSTSTLSLERAAARASASVSGTRDSQQTLCSPGSASPRDSGSKLEPLPEASSSTSNGAERSYRPSSLQHSPVEHPDLVHRSTSLNSVAERTRSTKRPHTASSTVSSRSLRVQTVTPAPSPLPAPPDVRFDSVAVAWKGLPLEAALWTFTSQELQQTVSRAIRSSANESFIRLLPLQDVDGTIPNEIERLRILKATTSSRYRFCVQRRTMLLQALNSFSTASPIQQDRDGGTAYLSSLAVQLAEITGECDKLADELVKITDQLGNLGKLTDTHWSSALAIALRKLNGSYGKRTADLGNARDRIAQLESELEDAWKEAKDMAADLDRIDAQRAEEALLIANEMVRQQQEAQALADAETDDGFDDGMDEDLTEDLGLDEGTAVIGKAEVISLHTKNSSFSTTMGRRTPTLLKLQPPSHNIPLTVLSSPVRDKMPEGIPRAVDDDDEDKISVISKKSARSRVSQVEAAQRRSVRTSMGSLRLPSRKDSLQNIPPVPFLSPSLIHHTSPIELHLRAHRASFLSLSSSKKNEDISAPEEPRRPVNINEIQLSDDYQPESSLRWQTSDLPLSGRRARPLSAMDDIGVMPRTATDEIEEVSRLPQRRSVDETTLAGAGIRYREQYPRLQQNIPSIWQIADAPKTPAERVELMMNMNAGPAKPGGAYQKFKSFTQRYSLPFEKLRQGSLGKHTKGHP